MGFTSQCELLDAWLVEDLPVQEISSALSAALPPGLDILHIIDVDLHAPVLQTQVISARYRIALLDPIPDLPDRLQRVLSAENLPRLRRGKPYDLRPLIEEATLGEQDRDGRFLIQVQMTARESATGRPEELLAELGVKFEDTHIHREKLILNSN
jgi:hypothetical protein